MQSDLWLPKYAKIMWALYEKAQNATPEEPGAEVEVEAETERKSGENEPRNDTEGKKKQKKPAFQIDIEEYLKQFD